MAQQDNAAMDVNQALPLLAGLSPAQFMRRHWQKRPLWVRQAIPGVVSPVTRAEMFALAARDDVESRLVHHDARDRWQLRHGPLPRRALPALAQPGWTLLVQGLDLHADAAHELLSRFRFVPAARLDDLMLSYASDGGGVGPHVDSYDVFLLQVSGRRHWRIGRAGRSALRDDVPLKMLASFAIEQEATLEPGDMLYLPPGWAHDGTAVGSNCMTASVGFRTPGIDELAQALLGRLADDLHDGDPVAPLRPYRDPAQPATDAPGAVPPALQQFARRALARALGAPRLLERALGEWLTEPKAQVWFDPLPGAMPIVGGAVRLDRRTRMAYDAHHVFINGESLRAAGRDARLMRELADRRRLVDRAIHHASPAARGQLCEWLANGWLHVHD